MKITSSPSMLLEAALEGRVSANQRFMLREQMRHIGDLDATIARLSAWRGLE